jgi:RimJ/RimL family protein N-acetyltransferase
MASASTNFEPHGGQRRLIMTLDLAAAPLPTGLPCRAAEPADKPALAGLMLDAYQGTVDYSGETADDALREIELTMSGSYGRFLSDCSFVVAAGGELAAACLVTLLDEGRPDETPLVAFSMTRKGNQRQGIGGALILRSAAALFEKGYPRVALVVTADNTPARRLYEKLGFRPQTTGGA